MTPREIVLIQLHLSDCAENLRHLERSEDKSLFKARADDALKEAARCMGIPLGGSHPNTEQKEVAA